MPNIKNFQSDITSFYGTKFTVSRIIENRNDSLLDMEVPADFAEKLLENNIEINLYSLADNSLLYSDVIKNSNKAIYVETLQYEDGTFRKLLFIDFAKVTALSVPPGRYSVTLNFFADEIGNYETRPLKVTRVSTARTEIELKLTDVELQDELNTFAIPRINSEYIRPILKQIFNQEGAGDLILPVSPAKIDSSSLYRNFASGSGDKLLQYNFDDDVGEFVGINTIAQKVLNEAYPIALTKIENKMLSGSTTFTETELTFDIVSAIDEVYDSALKDEEDNPQRYRFDLI